MKSTETLYGPFLTDKGFNSKLKSEQDSRVYKRDKLCRRWRQWG